MKLKMLCVALLLLANAIALQAAGTIAWSCGAPGVGGVTRCSAAWTSDASGDANVDAYTVRGGRIIRVAFIPGSGGSQPTDLYDVTLVDPDGVDVLAGAGANLSNASATSTSPNPPFYQAGVALDLVVANGGNAKSGTVVLFIE